MLHSFADTAISVRGVILDCHSCTSKSPLCRCSYNGKDCPFACFTGEGGKEGRVESAKGGYDIDL